MDYGKDLDSIIAEMKEVVENSKDEIVHISEETVKESAILQAELIEIKAKVIKYIEEGDELEQRVHFFRHRLSEVSKSFDRYSEEEIRQVYETTHELQTQLAIFRQEEKILRERRDILERQLLTLNETVERATGLSSKISVVLTYLEDDFQQVNQLIEIAKEKQEFSLQIIQGQEEERRRISREIHDGPAQMLANILLRSELVERIAKQSDLERAMQELKSVREMIRLSLSEVRRIIYDLRPMALDDLGLIPAIRKYVSTTADYHNIEIKFIHIGKQIRLKQEYEIAFFRLLQESLQNAIKHAEAKLIQVKLIIDYNYLVLIIHDHGKGFNPEKRREKSFGIIGMKERVEMLRGTLEIKSKLNEGTIVTISVPYEEGLIIKP